jgi:hypothetical protein
MRRVLWGTAILLAASAAGWIYLQTRDPPLPADLVGTLVFVSNRGGTDTLYAKGLPSGEERRLTRSGEPIRDPVLSPDGRRVTFLMGARLVVQALAGGDPKVLTFGLEWRDAQPAWLPDGRALVVASKRRADNQADLHLLLPDEGPGPEAARRPLTRTTLDESFPAVSPDGASVVHVREDQLFRLDLADGRVHRLTGGFRRVRQPRVLPSGRVAFLWSEGKRHGLDVIDLTGKNRETLIEGTVFYRSLAPSPDGRYLAATFAFDLGGEALRARQAEEVRLLDAFGRPVATLAGSWRYDNHSPDWGP